jgi:hypothetical protein
MKMAVKKQQDKEIQIVKVSRGTVTFCVLGTSPLILNRMSNKGARELLFPSRKTRAAKKLSFKHYPMEEFRGSPYTNTGNKKSTTYIEHLASAFKAAMRGAAVDMPGTVSKAAIGRLTRVEGDRVPIFGVPEMFMTTVRQAGQNRTPDIRTRAIIPEWACYLTVSFSKPQLNAAKVTNLLVAAGLTQGVGDWRVEKGSGSYGCFELVSESNRKFKRIVASGGRAEQVAAMDDPAFYDDETEELYNYWVSEAEQHSDGCELVADDDILLDATDDAAELTPTTTKKGRNGRGVSRA